MKQSSNLSPLAFYDDIRKQERFKPYVNGEKFSLICPTNRVLPFQFIINEKISNLSSSILEEVEFFDLDNHKVGSLGSPDIGQGGFRSRDISAGKTLVYCLGDDAAMDLPEQTMYMRIKVHGVDTYYYSELFTPRADLSSFIHIVWYDKENYFAEGGCLHFETDQYRKGDHAFKFEAYVEAELVRPEYKFSEVSKERDGMSYPEKQLSEKVYKYTFTAPESVIDGLRFLRLADFCMITDKFGNEYDVNTILLTPKWLENGFLANVECEFQTTDILKKIGKAYRRVGL